MDKPGDFFVGITEFFSVLMPGAAISYVLLHIELNLNKNFLGLLSLDRSAGYAAFFAISYLLGHVTDMMGALVLDPTYDLTYAHWKISSSKTNFAKWAKDTPGRVVTAMKRIARGGGGFDDSDMNAADALRRRAKDLAAQERTEGDGLHQWCRSWLIVKSPDAFAQIERLQASSKFFRGMVVVSVITASLSLIPHMPFHKLGSPLCLILGFICFLRYSYLRWKSVQQTYRFYALLKGEERSAVHQPN